jgi:hydroxymethylglutaryl-CoA synthase
VGFAATLDVANPDDRILLASYGSGAGSDAFSFVVQDTILEKRNPIPSVRSLISERKYIDYSMYVKFRGKIRA